MFPKCEFLIQCEFCSPSIPGILKNSKDGKACYCAVFGSVGKQKCCEPALVGKLCYDHAKSCNLCNQPYDSNFNHVCTMEN